VGTVGAVTGQRMTGYESRVLGSNQSASNEIVSTVRQLNREQNRATTTTTTTTTTYFK